VLALVLAACLQSRRAGCGGRKCHHARAPPNRAKRHGMVTFATKHVLVSWERPLSKYDEDELGPRAEGGVNLDTLCGDRACCSDEVPHSPDEVLEGRTVAEAARRRTAPGSGEPG